MPGDAVLTLFGECPVPACWNPVDDGRPCADCAVIIAEGWLREVALPERPAGAPVTLDAVRREIERAAAQDRGVDYKPGQVCWVCEERRRCRLDPEFTGTGDRRWICKDCEEVQ